MRSTKEIITDSLAGLFHNLKYILLLVLLISLPVAIIQACVVDTRIDLAAVTKVVDDAQAKLEVGETIGSEAALMDATTKMLTYYGISMLLSSFSMIVQIGVMLIIRNRSKGIVTGFGDVFETSMRLFPKVWLTQLLGSILMAIGLMFCVLPGLFMYFVFYMVPYGVVYTELWGRKGLLVSSLYSRKYGRKVIAMIFAGLLYSFAVSWMVEVIMGFVPASQTAIMISGTVSYCLQDLLACLPIACFSGMALSMDLGVDFSQLGKKQVVN